MELETSPLWSEIQSILTSDTKSTAAYYTADISFGDTTITSYKLISIDNIRNYESNIGDECIIDILLPLGTYAKQVYPNKHILEITLNKTVLSDIGESSAVGEKIGLERFKAIMLVDETPSLEGSDLDRYDEEALNLQKIITVSFQLLNRTLEKLRISNVGGIFRNTTANDVIKGILSSESVKVKVDSVPAITVVDMVDSQNKQKRDHIVIPQGTKLLEMPSYLQKRCGGVYATGLGTYLQGKAWWVYPLYDTQRFNTDTRTTLVIFKVPSKRFNNVERTYRVDGNSVFVLGTGDVQHKDDGETGFVIDGNGFQIAQAKQFMNGGAVAVEDNKAVVSRGKLNSEPILFNKADNVNNVQVSKNKISDNSFVEYTALTARNGGITTMEWQNAEPNLLIPGMCVKIHYMDNDKLVETNGTLLSVQILTSLVGITMTSKRHTTTCALSIFVNKIKK